MVRTSGHAGCSRAYLKFSKTGDNTSIRNAALPLPSCIVFPSSSTSLNSFREQHTLPVRVLMRTPLINWSLMLHDTQNKGSVCSLLFCRFIHYFYLFMCLCLCTSAHEGQERMLDPLELEFKLLWAASHGCWERNSGSLQEQQQVCLAAGPPLHLLLTFLLLG